MRKHSTAMSVLFTILTLFAASVTVKEMLKAISDPMVLTISGIAAFSFAVLGYAFGRLRERSRTGMPLWPTKEDLVSACAIGVMGFLGPAVITLVALQLLNDRFFIEDCATVVQAIAMLLLVLLALYADSDTPQPQKG